MNLSFARNFPKDKPLFNGRPTYFINKIWASLLEELPKQGLSPELEYSKLYNNVPTPGGSSLKNLTEHYRPKLHSIRSGKRWKPGSSIHFCTGLRTPNYKRFAPVLKCQAVEQISIKYGVNNDGKETVRITIEGKELNAQEALELALNEGFENLLTFLHWFDQDYDGFIIHWTAKRYGIRAMEVVDPETVRRVPLELFEKVKPPVLQLTIAQVKEAETALLKNVLKQYLNRDLLPEDSDLLHKLINEEKNQAEEAYSYMLTYNEHIVGTITAKTIEGGIRWEFEPNK